MRRYLVLIRGINVGGKNKISMAELRECLSAHGYQDVTTYIASGNVVLSSDKSQSEVAQDIEAILPAKFKLDSELVRVLVLTQEQLKSVVDNKPAGFGESPDKYHSDAIFLIGITAEEALPVFDPREGVDRIWPGDGVIYSERLSAERTKSRLGKIIGTKPYQSMTIRSWNTVTKLMNLF